ncbi:MAG: AMP-binding protein [Rhizonema sp. PD38]|nr:AMP-binding protein [Rhizonema sp. PD38]
MVTESNFGQCDHSGIHQLFEERVELSPNTVAVVFEDKQLIYRKLNELVNKIAHYLQALGVRLEGLVSICVERFLEMLVELLSILKAGPDYVPLDPLYPLERVAFMLKNAQESVLLTQASLAGIRSSHMSSIPWVQ